MKNRVLKTAEKMIMKLFPAIVHLLRDRVVPELHSLMTDDVKLEKALKMIFRFMPYPLRLVTSKEKFAAFIIKRKAKFFSQQSAKASAT